MDRPEKNKDESSDEAEMDDLVFRILTLMNQYISSKRTVENYIRAGCLDLAKARYIAGHRNISALQLPGADSVGLSAKFRVTRSKSCECLKFEKNEGENKEDDAGSVVESMDQMNLNGDESNAGQRVLRFSKDPLKWFGYLVPRNLKQSQLTFERCLEIVIECVNIQLELERNLNEYKKHKKLSNKKE